MELTTQQYKLLLDMVNASINMAANSGIPIAQEYWKDIDEIKQSIFSTYDNVEVIIKIIREL